jgi:WD40 repeat protein
MNRAVLFLAFANNWVSGPAFLPSLADEQRRVRDKMRLAERDGLCKIVERNNATFEDMVAVLQDAEYRDRIAIFHFSGHADGDGELVVAPGGQPAYAHAAGLARLLGEQHGLQLVFLNGCRSQGQVKGLLDAGVPAVIATAGEIEDRAAAEFSIAFYGALGSGASLRTAYAEAEGAVELQFGPSPPGATPWGLYTAPGAEEMIRRWSLPLAAHEPLFGLPAPPAVDLPAAPFKYLAFFTREDAPVFFGRGREIRELFDAVTASDGAPIVLVFGASGVGKSSLLAGGLQPRLEPSHEVLYARRQAALGAVGTLSQALARDRNAVAQGYATATAWRLEEEARCRPLVVILDQLEEIWTRPLAQGGEAEKLGEALQQLFAVRSERPAGRLVLSFRKEWLAEILALLDGARLPRTRVEVAHPDREAIEEVVAGLVSRADLVRRYRLEVEAELPALMASDLLEDPGATVAPVLQILLTKMWAEANRENPAAPRFSIELYLRLKRSGILLDDFLAAQLEALRAAWSAELDSGLALDLLTFHTTSLGTAETRALSEIVARYAPRQEVLGLLEACRERYLLVAGRPDWQAMQPERKSSRLAHDLLAPLIQRRCEASNLPGQQALRILEHRAAQGRVGAPLDDFDLARVQDGVRGMRALTADEEALLVLSRRQANRRKRQREVLRLAAALGAAILLAAALVAFWQRRQALASERRARDRELAALGANLATNRPTEAALVLLEIPRPDDTPTTSDTLRRALEEPLTLATLSGHTGYVQAASFSPDGRRIVTASADQSARLWNATTGELQSTLAGRAGWVWAASFSPDGTRVVTTSHDKVAHIWSATSGRLLASLIGHAAAVWAASFSPDGRRVATASWDKTARIWDAATGRPVLTLTGHGAEVWAASFSPDGTRVATASLDHTARVWDAATGKQICTLAGHTDEVAAAVWSPDGARVATVSWDNSARLWDAMRCRLIVTLRGHYGAVSAASFNHDGSRIATASRDHTARIWDSTTGKLIVTLTGHTDEVVSAIFNPEGSCLLTASMDRTARVWNTTTGELVATLKGHTGGLTAASFSPDGRRAVTASRDETARVWALSGNEAWPRLGGGQDAIWDASWSFDGSRVVTASGDKTARIWSATGQLLRTLRGHADEVLASSFSPDGGRVLTASKDRTAWIWSVATGRPLSILGGHGREILGAAFSSDGKRIVTVSFEPSARIWDLASGKVTTMLLGHGAGVRRASFSADGRHVVTASFDHTARIWDAATGEPVVSLQGHTGEVMAATFNADGTQVVTASADRTARVWSVAGGKSLAVLAGHDAAVLAASFDASGERVVTGSLDQTARIWKAATGQIIATLSGHHGGVWAASFSPDGARVLTGSLDATARIWPASGEYLQSRVRARTPLCLDARFRQAILGEAVAQAAARERACKLCVPRFQAHLDGAPASDWRTHLAAWEAYRECLSASGT